MRLNSRSVRAHVRTSDRRERHITLEVAGLCFALSRSEAHKLADQLHDIAETRTR